MLNPGPFPADSRAGREVQLREGGPIRPPKTMGVVWACCYTRFALLPSWSTEPSGMLRKGQPRKELFCGGEEDPIEGRGRVGRAWFTDAVLQQEERTLEEPGVGELQIAVRSTGICGSDVSYYKKFANGDLCALEPLSLGHESSGVVVGIGLQVSGFGLGDRVALEVGVPCDTCSICRKGRYNLCKKLRFRSSAKSYPHYQGTLQERINHPARWCHK